MRSIFVNIATKDIEAAKRFYDAIGFRLNPQFSDDESACYVIEENIVLMVLTEPKLSGFLIRPIGDAAEATQMTLSISCTGRDEVDAMIRTALDAGGGPWKPAQDYGFMYAGSFQDPDGHVWEPAWMDPARLQPT